MACSSKCFNRISLDSAMNCSWSNCSAATGTTLLRTAAGLLAGANAAAKLAQYRAVAVKRANFMVTVELFCQPIYFMIMFEKAKDRFVGCKSLLRRRWCIFVQRHPDTRQMQEDGSKDSAAVN
mmetsp:Transcript_10767/g.25488  ORF Transcript_10767/g.25488 Transcript_10767/m.25488 type:complete len:123 (-) Transcript_10767:66-434(-)